MNIALPILLLVFGGLSFWILTESNIKWYIKTAAISIFCLFTIIFWMTIHTFLGWPAKEEDVPRKVRIHWVVIKEPNKFEEFEGAIYVLLESAEEIKANGIGRFFGYTKDRMEPRLFALKYSRSLHERLEEIKKKLKKGQAVVGTLTKEGQQGLRKKGTGKSSKKGGGSESQEQDWEFHELRPSEIQEKPRQSES